MDIEMIILFAAAFGLAVTLVRRDIRRSKKRQAQLELAAQLLNQHYAALDTFLRSPNAPVEAQRLALHLSNGLENERVVLAVARDMWENPEGFDSIEPRPGLIEACEQMDTRLQDTFLQIVSAGLMSALLRCEETAAMIDWYAPALDVYPKHKASFAERMAQAVMPQDSTRTAGVPA